MNFKNKRNSYIALMMSGQPQGEAMFAGKSAKQVVNETEAPRWPSEKESMMAPDKVKGDDMLSEETDDEGVEAEVCQLHLKGNYMGDNMNSIDIGGTKGYNPWQPLNKRSSPEKGMRSMRKMMEMDKSDRSSSSMKKKSGQHQPKMKLDEMEASSMPMPKKQMPKKQKPRMS